jgi:signal recognition particle receptor subunit beta
VLASPLSKPEAIDMVFFNYATMQMAAKIVYYGPGLCGKTTNLHHIYTKTSPGSRGEMVSLETETDRTLFFDLLPIDVGVIGGFKTRLQLYTVPGQVFYNTTRKLVLKGVDGIVFVADSQLAMLDANVESLKNLRENLAEIGVNLDELPLVLQLNKRDLPNVAPVEMMLEALDPERRLEHAEAVATSGVGVFETLKQISKLTLRTLRRRMTGDEPARATSPPARTAQFRVRDDNSRTSAPTITIPDIAEAIAEEVAPAPPEPRFDPEATIAAAAIDPRILANVPIAEPEPAVPVDESTRRPVAEETGRPVDEEEAAEAEVGAPPTPAPESLDDSATRRLDDSAPVEPAPPKPEVKTVKVRSSVDVMAELEALRKRATQSTPKAPRRDIVTDFDSLRPKRDLHRSLHVQLPQDVLPRTRTVRVTLTFEDEAAGVIETRDQQLELGETSDVQSLSVNVKIDLS